MLQQVLNLDRDVVREAGKLVRQRLDHPERMPNAVEKVRVAKRDVLGAGRHLRADIRQDDVDRDDPKASVVNGDDRAVPAEVLAAAARFRVADDPMLTITRHE